MKTQELQTIRGYVSALPRTPGKEDLTKVAVITDDGTEYRVLHKSAGMDLADYISANVEVTGTVSVMASPKGETTENDDADSILLITVRRYTLTDGYDDPWYDDDA